MKNLILLTLVTALFPQENENPVQGEDVVIQSLVSGATEVELMVTTNDFNAQFTSKIGRAHV